MHHVHLQDGMCVADAACHSAHVFAVNQYRNSQRFDDLLLTIIVYFFATKRTSADGPPLESFARHNPIHCHTNSIP